jgi:predicted RNA-binding Zn ribbon-like protein
MATTAAHSTAPPRELPIIGGHLALDFANTVDDPGGSARWDHLSSVEDLLDWFARIGVIDPALRRRLARAAREHPRKALAAHRRAIALRRTLNAVFGAVADGDDPDPRDWAALRARAAEGLGCSDLVRSEDGYVLRWDDSADLESMLWPVADAAVRLLRSTDLARLKRCAGCPWLFLDRSKNSSRRWCAMNDCGTHEKIQRYVSRRAANRTAKTVLF